MRKQMKDTMKNKTFEELLRIEIECTRIGKNPHIYGVEVAKFNRSLKRLAIREQVARKLASWARLDNLEGESK